MLFARHKTKHTVQGTESAIGEFIILKLHIKQ